MSTTQIILLDDEAAIGQFDMLVGNVIPQLMATEGLVGMSFAGEDACGSQRTLSIWEDTASMYAFTSSGAHAEAMAMTTEVSAAGRVTHWEIDAADGPPTWEDALGQIADVPLSGLYE